MTEVHAADKQWFDAYEVQGRQIDQQSANYDPLGMSDAKGCANCRWFIGPGACVIVGGSISPTGISDYWMAVKPDSTSGEESVMAVGEMAVAGERAVWSTSDQNDLPDSSFLYIEPGGSKDSEGKTTPRSLRHFPVKDADGKPDEAHIRNALARIPQSGVSSSAKSAALTRARSMAKRAGIEVAAQKSLGDSVKTMITDFISLVRGTDDVGNVISLKETDEGVRFMCTYTNNFEDKERSIFAQAAHRNYEEWVATTKSYPELWVWHTPGTRLGVADWVAESDGVLFASGLVDVGQELRAYQLATTKDLGMSHGFLYGDVVDGVVNKYRSYEMSLLPRQYAANEATTFALLGERAMAFSDARKAFLKEKGLYTDEEITQMEQGAAQLREHMQALGVDMKDTEEAAETEMQTLIKGQQAMLSAITALATGLTKVEATATAAGEAAAAAAKSLDEAVADKMTAEIAKLPAGVKATEDDSNVVETKEAQADVAWFEKAMQGIGAAAGFGGSN